MLKSMMSVNEPYKRVAWPPAPEHRPTAREFTPQPQQFSQQPSQDVHYNQTPNSQSPQTHYYQEKQPLYQPQLNQAHPPYAQQQYQKQHHHNHYSNNLSGPNTFSNSQVHNHKEHVIPIVVEGARSQLIPNSITDNSNRWQHVRTPTVCRTGYVLQQPPQQQYSSAVPQSTGSWQGQNTTAPEYASTYQNNAGVVTSSSPGYHQDQYAHSQPQRLLHSPSPYLGAADQVDCNSQQYRHCSQPPMQSSHCVVDNQQSNYSQAYRGESPGIIQLRKEAPFNQKPSAVYQAQPAAATFQGGVNMRGDLRWPPPEYKEQAVAANEERHKIAAGPVCRPRRVTKDYSQFFAKNQINNYYPGYRVPPGTQHVNCS